MTEVRVVQASRLPVPAAQVWARVTTEKGIRYEMWPLLRMTRPRGFHGDTITDVEPGVPLGRSWLLLFGLLPVDYDDVCLAEIGPGARFLERSTMLSMTRWTHERTVEDVASGSEIRDRLSFTPRGLIRVVPGGRALARAAVAAFFRYRHRRLRKFFGAGAPSAR